MSLSDKQIKHVCLFGSGGRQCRFLERTHDHTTWKQVFNCFKKVPASKRQIDKATNKYIQDEKSLGRDPFTQGWQACGDGGSCQGYLYLPTVEQGFDVKTN